jgi:hypothetical protein
MGRATNPRRNFEAPRMLARAPQSLPLMAAGALLAEWVEDYRAAGAWA